MMKIDIWNREDVTRILSAVVIARSPLTSDDVKILIAVAAGFGIEPEAIGIDMKGETRWPGPT